MLGPIQGQDGELAINSVTESNYKKLLVNIMNINMVLKMKKIILKQNITFLLLILSLGFNLYIYQKVKEDNVSATKAKEYMNKAKLYKDQANSARSDAEDYSDQANGARSSAEEYMYEAENYMIQASNYSSYAEDYMYQTENYMNRAANYSNY